MTWAELAQRLTAWLSLKRKLAEGLSELPTLDDVRQRVEDILMTRLEIENEPHGEKSLADLVKKYDLDVREADLRTITLLGVLAEEQTPKGTVASGATSAAFSTVTVGTWVGEYLYPVAQLAVFNKDLDGQYVPTSVAATEPNEDDDVWLAVVEAVKIQESQQTVGRDVIARWVAAPRSFREKHIICPCCASSKVRNMEDGFGEKQWVGCDECNWVASPKLVEDITDLLDRERFREEASREQQRQQTVREIQETISATKALASKLTDMLNAHQKEAQVDKGVAKDVWNVIELLEKSAIAIDAQSEPRKITAVLRPERRGPRVLQ